MNRQRLKSRRLELNLTLQDVANKMGLTRGTVQKYESGYIKGVDTATLEKLAKALDTTPAYLMGWEPEENEDTSKIDSVIFMHKIQSAIANSAEETYIIHGSEGNSKAIKSKSISKDVYALVGDGEITPLTKPKHDALKTVLKAMDSDEKKE